MPMNGALGLTALLSMVAAPAAVAQPVPDCSTLAGSITPIISTEAEEPPHAPLLHSQAEVQRLIVCNLKDRDREERMFARRFDRRLAAIQAKVSEEFGREKAGRHITVLTYCETVRPQPAFDKAYRERLVSFVGQLRAWEARYRLDPKRRTQ